MTDRTRRLAGNAFCLTPPPTRRLLGAVSLTALMLGVATPLASPARAQTPAAAPEPETSAARSFAIAPQSLNKALDAFSEATGISFAYPSGELAGLRSPGASGAMTPRDALAQLLAGTGVSYRFSGTRTVTLTRSSANTRNDGPIEAGPLMIEGGVVSGRRNAAEDAPFETPGSTAYISREQIERIQPTSPGDIFKEVPGVLSGASNDGTSINVNIRSSQGLNRVRTMVEGTQQESSGYQGYAGADQRTYIDPELIGGVEIAKGPGGGPYGTGTTSGVVNVRLLDADDLIREGRDFGVRVRGGLGGNAVAPRFGEFVRNRDADAGLVDSSNDILTDDNWFGSFAGAYSTERFDLVAAYARRKEGNYFAGEHGPETFLAVNRDAGATEPDELKFARFDKGQEVANTSQDTESVLVKGTLRLGDGQSLEAGYTYYDSAFGQVFPSNLNLFAPQQYSLNEVESNRYWLRYKWDSANPLIDLQANLWRTNARELGESRQGSQENDAWGAEIWNTSILDTGFGDLTLTYGAEYTTSEAVVDAPVFFNNFVCVRGEGCSTVRDEFSPSVDSSREVYGAYLNAAYTPNDWLTLTAGIRYDGFSGKGLSTEEFNTIDFSGVRAAEAAAQELVRGPSEARQVYQDAIIADFTAGSITIDEAIFLLNFAPEAVALNEAVDEAFAAGDALVAEARLQLDGIDGTLLSSFENDGERVSPRFGVTVEPIGGLQIFAQYAEGFRALSLVELGQTYNAPVVINTDLEGEVVKTWEAGVNYLRDDLFLKGDAFRAKLTYFNNDYDNFISRTGIIDGRLIFFFENVPDVTISGYEASVYYDAGRVFADLNFNVFDDPFDTGTQASIQQPEYTGTFTLGTRWLNDDLELGGRLTFFGEAVDDDGVIESGFSTEALYYWTGQEIVDLFGSYRFNDTVAVGFGVENLTDQYYVPPLFVSRIPSPGRTVRVNATITF